ncbi:MAG: IS4 family transposase [Ardenticatenales bacterium]|nr:IS4 family transposase [Ardenticatenales bacterium]
MSQEAPSDKKKRKKSTVRHTRAIQRDRTKRPTSPPLDEQLSARLTELVHPATLAQVAHFHQLGLRERVLTLPIMVALVLSLIWRQIGSVNEVVRVVRQEVVLWSPPVRISQQAFASRLRCLPASLFEAILHDILPRLHEAWASRTRPLPPEVQWANEHYEQVLIVDGSTLDSLLRKVGLLKGADKAPLAGRMAALLCLGSRLPQQVWYEPDAAAHDQRFWERVLRALPAGALLLFDLGFTNFSHFAQLSAQQVTFITRAKRNLAYQVAQALLVRAAVRDQIVWIGQGDDRQQVRLIEVLYRGTWYHYLTNELDPLRLPTEYVVALYFQRWRIEDAYALVKRLLGLAYFWCGAQNAVQLQLWATWLLDAVLLDLTDAVAETLHKPVAALSIEMVYRAIYHFTQAFHQGQATDLIAYLALNADWLGILKRPRASKPPPLLVVRNLTTVPDP